MTNSTEIYSESVCALEDFDCLPLKDGKVLVFQYSKLSKSVKAKVWDSNSQTYLSTSVLGIPATGILSADAYAKLKYEGDRYTIEVSDTNQVVLVEKPVSSGTSPVYSNMIYDSEFNDKKVSVIVVGGLVVACVVAGIAIYVTKNPVLAESLGLTSAEIVGGTISKQAIKKVLDILGSYMILNIMKKEGTPTGYAAKIEDSFTEAEGTRFTPAQDPLLLDLDGDGIETTSVEEGVYFDHGNDGFEELSAWVGTDDGILVHDKNNNGVIDNGNEMFGDNYTKLDGTVLLAVA